MSLLTNMMLITTLFSNLGGNWKTITDADGLAAFLGCTFATSRETLTDWLLFSASLHQFQEKKAACWHHDVLDWSDDGCSHAEDYPDGYNFLPSC